MTEAGFSEAYSDGVKKTIRCLLGRGVPFDVAPDVAQSAWLRGWEKLDQLRDDAMLVPWVNTIAMNYYRRDIRNAHREVAWNAAYLDVAATFPNTAEIDVHQILEACSPGDRNLLRAQMMGSTSVELAEKAGMTSTAVRIRLHRARRRAREFCESHVRADHRQAA